MFRLQAAPAYFSSWVRVREGFLRGSRNSRGKIRTARSQSTNFLQPLEPKLKCCSNAVSALSFPRVLKHYYILINIRLTSGFELGRTKYLYLFIHYHFKNAHKQTSLHQDLAHMILASLASFTIQPTTVTAYQLVSFRWDLNDIKINHLNN